MAFSGKLDHCRILITAGGSYTLTITQPDFVEDMLLEFGSHLSTATVNVPFEPGTVLGVNEPDFDPDPAKQAKYKEMGVLTRAGKLHVLWLSKRGYNMLMFGVTQLCSIMSKPSQKMWTAGLRMLGWLRDNYKLGIRFHSNVIDPPCHRASSMTQGTDNTSAIQRLTMGIYPCLLAVQLEMSLRNMMISGIALRSMNTWPAT